MNAWHSTQIRRSPASRARGFTLVELMVTVGIAVFLLFGLVTIVENVRLSYANQQGLAQLQDEQRFVMTVITDVVQNGGYLPNQIPLNYVPSTSFPASGAYASVPAGSAFAGAHTSATAPDTLHVRYLVGPNDNSIQCDGSQSNGATTLYDNAFTVVQQAVTATKPTAGYLTCTLNGGAAINIATGVQNLQVYYGVNRNNPGGDYNIDTYLTADQMKPADWTYISSVMVIVSFTNPLFGQAGMTAASNQTISFLRVIPVMARVGMHS